MTVVGGGQWLVKGAWCVGHGGGVAVAGEWVGGLLAMRDWRKRMRCARTSALCCAEHTQIRSAKTEPTHGAEPNIHVHIKHATPNVGGWLVGGVRVVAGGRMGGGWVYGRVVGVLRLGKWLVRWLVNGWLCCW